MQWCQRPTLLQHFKKTPWSLSLERIRQLLPQSFPVEGREFTRLGHAAHQLHGLRNNAKVESGRKPGAAQQAQRVFHKSRRNMSQRTLLQVLLAFEQIDHHTMLILDHGIDSQVTSNQILFQGNFRPGLHHKTLVARTALGLGAGQGVLFTRLRV